MESEFRLRSEGDNLVVELDVPDLKRDEIKVLVEGDYVRVEGKRELSKEARAGGFYAKEEKSSNFLKQIGLPVNVKSDEAKIEYLDGGVRIRIPKVK